MTFMCAIGLLGYDPLKISAILTISFKFNIIFAKFLEILEDNNITSMHTHIRLLGKNHSKVI